VSTVGGGAVSVAVVGGTVGAVVVSCGTENMKQVRYHYAQPPYGGS